MPSAIRLTSLSVALLVAIGPSGTPRAAQADLPACLVEARWSTDPIARSMLKDAYVGVKTNRGNLALMHVLTPADDLRIEMLQVFTPSGQQLLAKPNLVVRSSFGFDVDAGAEAGAPTSDFWWHTLERGLNQIEPQNGAAAYLCPARQAGGGYPSPASGGKKVNGEQCNKNAECASGSCADGRRCAPPEGTGGPDDYCHRDSQCDSSKGLICGCLGTGRSPGYHNGDLCDNWDDPRNKVETGRCIPRMAAGDRQCWRSEDCAAGLQCVDIRRSRALEGGVCAPVDGTGKAEAYCHHDNHCGTRNCRCPNDAKSFGFCANWENYTATELRQWRSKGFFQCLGVLPLGSPCASSAECGTGRQCANGQRCAPLDGRGRSGEYCHHDNHCQTRECLCPQNKSLGFCANWEQGFNLGTCK